MNIEKKRLDMIVNSANFTLHIINANYLKKIEWMDLANIIKYSNYIWLKICLN